VNTITKVSEISAIDVAEFIRLEMPSLSEIGELTTYLNAARSYVKSHTGLSAEEMDEFPDLVEPVLLYCQDMWDNRTIYVDTNNINKVFDATLGLHARNLL
jgi:hypothetical protein